MRFLIVLILAFGFFISAHAQVKFLDRYEVVGQPFDPPFEIMRTESGLVSFRAYVNRNLSSAKVLQYFITDENLESAGLIEVNIRNGYEILGYDTDGDELFVLLTRGYHTGADKYILQVNLTTNMAYEYRAENLLPLELIEFLVQDRKAIFMGKAEGRPALQLYDLDTKRIQTVQGIYGNDTEVLQIKKVPVMESLEVVISRKGKYKNRETSIFTFDMEGNVVREVKVDQFGKPGQEILEGILLANESYQQVMIGSYGIDGKNSYQGMYVMNINDFGEYEFLVYSLEDFPNFYNYLDEKRKAKQDAYVVKEVEKGKVPSIRNTYTIRDVRESKDDFLVYFDQVNVISSRGGRSGLYAPFGPYRYDRFSRMGYSPIFMDPQISALPPTSMTQSYSVVTEYQYISGHFVKIGKEGNVIWDNSFSYDNLTTTYPDAFGEVAEVGDDLYHLYLEEDKIKASLFRNGERLAENLSFDLEIPTENNRIRTTEKESLRLVHWYDRYYLLSGKQTVRYLNSDNREATKDVFFMAKILVDADLYQPEEIQD